MNKEKNVEKISYQFVSESLKVIKSFLVHAIVELDAQYEKLDNEMDDEVYMMKIDMLESLVENLDTLIKILKD